MPPPPPAASTASTFGTAGYARSGMWARGTWRFVNPLLAAGTANKVQSCSCCLPSCRPVSQPAGMPIKPRPSPATPQRVPRLLAATGPQGQLPLHEGCCHPSASSAPARTGCPPSLPLCRPCPAQIGPGTASAYLPQQDRSEVLAEQWDAAYAQVRVSRWRPAVPAQRRRRSGCALFQHGPSKALHKMRGALPSTSTPLQRFEVQYHHPPPRFHTPWCRPSSNARKQPPAVRPPAWSGAQCGGCTSARGSLAAIQRLLHASCLLHAGGCLLCNSSPVPSGSCSAPLGRAGMLPPRPLPSPPACLARCRWALVWQNGWEILVVALR